MDVLSLGFVFALLALRSSVICQNSSFYRAVLSPAGLPMCALDKPANRTYCVASSLRCATDCKTFNGCTRFNYYQSSNGTCNTCSLFCYSPKLFDTVVGCKHFVYRTLKMIVAPDTVTNIALKKPAFANAVDRFWRANDGDLTTRYYDMAAVPIGNFTWLSIDLGNPVYVYLVSVSNSIWTPIDQLSNFYVGLTNADTKVTEPLPNNFQLCGYWNGGLALGQWATLTCISLQLPYRYVVVGKWADSKGFLLTEVNVYAANVTWQLV